MERGVEIDKSHDGDTHPCSSEASLERGAATAQERWVVLANSATENVQLGISSHGSRSVGLPKKNTINYFNMFNLLDLLDLLLQLFGKCGHTYGYGVLFRKMIQNGVAQLCATMVSSTSLAFVSKRMNID